MDFSGEMGGMSPPRPSSAPDDTLSMLHKMDRARKVDAPVVVLETLALDPDRWVRYEVACNTSTPIGMLITLAIDIEPHVREGVASNQSTPIRVLEQLSTDPGKYIRHAVAGNSSTSVTALSRLAMDSTAYVASVALENPNLPGYLRALASAVRPL